MSVNSKMTAIADAIRAKTGGTDTLTLDQMATDLNVPHIVNVSADTVTADTLAEGITAHDAAGNAIIGTMAAGGGVEISTLTIEDRGFGWNLYIYFVDVNGQLFTHDTITIGEAYSVPKFSLVVVGYGGGGGAHFYEGVTLLATYGYGTNGGAKVYQVTESNAKFYIEI